MWLYIGIVLIVAVLIWKFVIAGTRSTPPPEFSRNITFSSAPKLVVNANKKQVKEKKEGQVGVKVFFGSQTGTAEDFANTLVEEGNSYNFFAEICDLEDYATDDLENEQFAIFVLATYGEGEPTDNAKEFYEWLMSEEREPGSLSNLKYTVFGLGNKTYEQFNAVARKVDTRLEELGAKRVFEKGEGDDDSSLQEDFDAWKGRLWEPVCTHFGIEFKSAATIAKPSYTINVQAPDVKHTTMNAWNIKGFNRNIIDVKNPVLCKVTVNRELHTSKSDRSCRHIEIELHPKMKYTPGDHIGIFPENDENEVREWIKYFDLDPNQLVTVTSEEAPNRPLLGPCTIQRILTNFVDITSPPKKKLLQVLAALYTSDENEQKKIEELGSSTERGWEVYNEYIKNPQRTLIEFLKDFPSCKPAFNHILELAPHLQPRYYSISSSIKENPTSVHVTAVLVSYKTGTGRLHNGLCTTYLSKQSPADGKEYFVPCFIRTSTFRLPRNPELPIIMVGPGTGLAPFRGFLQERKHCEFYFHFSFLFSFCMY